MSINNISFTGIRETSKPIVSSFAGAKRYTLDKEMQKEIQALMPKPIQALNKMKSFAGEVPNIIINAIGTGLVAPVFIKYNFLSKADDETRTYSALRQPISAILSVVTQAGLLIPLNSVMDKMSNAGELGVKYNKTGFQDLSHIEKLVKKQNPNFSKKQITEQAKTIQLSQLEPLMKNVKNKNTIQYMVKGKKVSISEQEFSKLLSATVGDMHTHVVENLERLETEKRPSMIQRGEYLRTQNSKVKLLLESVLEKTKATTDHNEITKLLKSEIKTLQANKADKELITILTEISKRPDAETIKSKASDVIKKCANYAKCKSKEEVAQKVEDVLSKGISKMNSDKAVIEEIQATIKKAVHKDATAAEKLEGTVKKLLKKANKVHDSNLTYDVVQKHIKNVNANVKGFKQIVGLGVSLAILPLTCSLLNYVYPKFMDLAFPSLSKTKHSKEKDKLIKGCENDAKTAEVANTEVQKQEVSK